MDFQILSANADGIKIRSFSDGRDWHYGIVDRDGQRVMADAIGMSSSPSGRLPSVAEAALPYVFACDEAHRRGLID